MNSAIRQVINIANSDLTIIEHKGERVVTLAMVDQVHQRPDGTAKRNFHENRDRFVEGKHYFDLTRDEIRTELPQGAFDPRAPRGTLLTQRGYLLLVKSFTDELSWQVQDMLVDGYFEGQRLAAPPVTQRIALSRHRLALAKELYRTRDPALRQTIHQQLDEVSRAMGLPTPEIDTIGRSAPPAPDVLKEFWQALAFLDSKGVAYNHSRRTDLLAINLPELARLLTEHGQTLRIGTTLRRALWESKEPRCLHKNHPTSSKLVRRGVRCWVFEAWNDDAVGKWRGME
ncbi:ORF6N domain-containing protein [Pseudomonas citronellolis]|uniref:ORF6N domain-containing protein n=1 Tax=Pseudomonas citronellolis TaxID=53408 RepID=UPI00211376C5|nr:ORF6N domain-containing protein [Pseudomonas citronellolis]UUC51632.1 ORF6N domain-containing protein [Pseudomonas citronellolis]